MNNLRYSIVYAVIRPEIIERISVGLITIDNNNIHYRYSDAKLKALEQYKNELEYESKEANDRINSALEKL